MSKALNVVALISGGKDSLYTLLHCIQNGHKVVALANIYPRPPIHADLASAADEDINSFMYQTVGHGVIPLYAQALQLPLYRQQTTGKSTQTGRYYDASLLDTFTDETEDLVPLLEDVIRNHPEINALCSGAILSTYQRTRIESVALRMGLIPLAYLWQYPLLPPPFSRLDSLTGLLEDMEAAGCESRIIKTASGGMPEDMLWTNVADPETMKRIVGSMAPFFEDDESGLRGAVLGEGGEFETLALYGPGQVWKASIEVAAEENVVVSEEGGVKLLRVGHAKVVERNTDTSTEAPEDLIRVPSAFDPQFQQITAMESRLPILHAVEKTAIKTIHLHKSLKPTCKVSFESHTVSIANITCNNAHMDAAQQMQRIVSDVTEILSRMSTTHQINPPLSPSSIISTTLLLASMSSFPSVNTSYSQLFSPSLPNPPARVTIASSLPPGILVTLSCTISMLPRSVHRGLHVQSRSYWAPANIGPYSQAISVPTDPDDRNSRSEFVHVAGQIPLVPASMEILPAPFTEQAVLALQHLWRVGQDRGVDLWTWGVAFLPRSDDEEEQPLRPHIAAKVWEAAHMTTVEGRALHHNATGAGQEDEDPDEDESGHPGPDAWDLKHNRMLGGSRVVPTVGKHRHVLPNSTVISKAASDLWIPPTIIAEVEELPRSAPIEWHSHGLGGMPKDPGSTTPRVVVGLFDVDRCAVSACSYLSVREGESNDDAEREEEEEHHVRQKSAMPQHQHFVTVLVPATVMTGHEAKMKTLSEVLAQVLSRRSVSSGGPEGNTPSAGLERPFSCVYGAAYIDPMHGEAAFAALGGLAAMPGVAVIYCRQLWGGCHQVGIATKDRPGIVKLSLALTLRIDTFATLEVD